MTGQGYFGSYLKNQIFPFSTFFGQKYFFQKFELSHKKPHGPLTPYLDSEKTNEPIPRTLLDWKTEEQTDPNSQNPSDHVWVSNKWYDEQLLDQQHFRTGRGTADGIFFTKKEWNKSLCIAHWSEQSLWSYYS